MKIDILRMTREEILRIEPTSINWMLSWVEILHILKVLGCAWFFDYDSPGISERPHAWLKSDNHSDGFLNIKEALTHEVIRQIFAFQILDKYLDFPSPRLPIFVCGIPSAATKLGQELANLLFADTLFLEKDEKGKMIIPQREIDKVAAAKRSNPEILLVEDLCSFGTGVTEAIMVIKKACPEVHIQERIMYILNRGNLKEIHVDDIGLFRIDSLADVKIATWDPRKEECELCKRGSKAIKPKDPPENWNKFFLMD